MGADSDDQNYVSTDCFTPWSNPTLIDLVHQPASDNLGGPSAGEALSFDDPQDTRFGPVTSDRDASTG